MEQAYRILVVDDTPINLELVVNALSELGCGIATAGNGAEALAMIERGKFDLILLDYLMPDMSGLEVLKTLRRQYSLVELPVLMLTGYYDAAVVIEAMRQGANDYISKPFEFEVLKARIDAQLSHRNMTQRLQRSQQAAEAASLSKSRFVSYVSHELRNPLNSVVGYCDLMEMLMKRGGDSRYLEYLDHIRSASQHILKLTNELLDMAQIEAGKLRLDYQDVAINGLVEAIAAEMQPLMRKHHNQLQVRVNPELAAVNTDAVRLRQIIDNLLSNCGKNTRNGRVTLVIDTLRENADAKLCISVRDNGRGIPRDKLGGLFREFGRVHEGGGNDSAGLGLVITRQLCERMGGSISVDSEEGAGTVFTVLLPMRSVTPRAVNSAG